MPLENDKVFLNLTTYIENKSKPFLNIALLTKDHKDNHKVDEVN